MKKGKTFLWKKFLTVAVFVMAVFVFASSAEAAQPIPQAERDALIDLYNSTNGDSWDLNGGWNGAVGTECGWQGVVCYCEVLADTDTPCPDDQIDNVMGLWFEDNNLTGTLPASLADIMFLDFLNFDFNSLTGEIPSSFSNMGSLVSLYLWDNNMSGVIPDFSNVPLVELDLEGNDFTSYGGNSFPSSLSYFWAGGNNFSDDEVNRILTLYLNNLANRPTEGEIDLSGSGMGMVDLQGIEDVETLENHGFSVYVNYPTDADSDGFYAEIDDCDDDNDAVYPGAEEICDGLDNDCDGATADGNSETAPLNSLQNGVCENSTQTCESGNWTDNYTSVVSYEADEELSCDGLDNDCDGEEDEDGILTTYFLDSDGDGYGDGLEDTDECTQPIGYVENDEDCDDDNPNVNPDAIEICDGIDNNCDGETDEGFALETFYEDEDGDGYGAASVPMEACMQPSGYVTDNTDCADSNPDAYPGGTEVCGDLVDQDCDGFDLSCNDVDDDGDGFTENEGDCNDDPVTGLDINPLESENCNGIDDNCNGEIDEGLTINTYYFDNDQDTFGDLNNTQDACVAPDGYVADNTDCNDSDNTINPNATEICDGEDNDCDGENNEDLEIFTYYEDSDGDFYGDFSSTQDYCVQPDGYVADNTDCNDDDSSVNPGVAEVACDGIDQDCNGSDDEGTDADNDGFKTNGGSCGEIDCDDTDENINPDATEICDGIDNNCDGETDEGFDFVNYYEDSDNDSYGDPSSVQSSCSVIDGYVTNDEDCDDTDEKVNPDGEEVCDGMDNNCNGEVDEGFNTFIYFRDADADAFGDPSNTEEACMQPIGYVIDNTDCDDSDSDSNPNGEEVCDGEDNDCDGEVDEDLEDCEIDDDDDDDDDSECGDLDIEDLKVKEITETSVVISFETSHDAKGSVRYGTDKDDLDEKEKFDEDDDHEIELDDLEPGETYYFRVKVEDDCDEEEKSKVKSFTTKGGKTTYRPAPNYNYDYLDDDNGEDDSKKATENVSSEVIVDNVNTDTDVDGNGETSTTTEIEVLSDEAQQTTDGVVVAGVSDEGKCYSWPPFWVWVLIFIVILATFAYSDYRNYNEDLYGWKVDLVTLILAVLFWYLFDKCHIYLWFLYGSIIGGVASHGAYSYYFKKKDADKEEE